MAVYVATFWDEVLNAQGEPAMIAMLQAAADDGNEYLTFQNEGFNALVRRAVDGRNVEFVRALKAVASCGIWGILHTLDTGDADDAAAMGDLSWVFEFERMNLLEDALSMDGIENYRDAESIQFLQRMRVAGANVTISHAALINHVIAQYAPLANPFLDAGLVE